MALTEAASSETDDTASAVDAATTVTGAARSGGPERVLGSGDHATIGRVFVGAALLFGLIDLVLSALVNFDAAAFDSATGEGFLKADVATRFALNHQLSLLLCCVLPLVLGLGLIIVPRQLGAAAIAFPRAAALSLWTWLLSSILFLAAVTFDGSYGGADAKFARLGNVATGAMMVALCIGAVCVAVTVLTFRPVGMSVSDVPFFSFAMLVASSVWVLSLPAALAQVILGHIIRPSAEDLVRTYDNFSWLLRQPAIYVALIPLLGIAADVISTSTGARQRFRAIVLANIGLAGLLSFGAWAQNDVARGTFVWVLLSAAFSLPLLGVLGAIADTLNANKPKFIAPLGFAIVSVLLGLLAALVGLLESIDSIGRGQLIGFGTKALDTGQLYLVMGAALTAGIGGAVYWAKQSVGGQLPDLVTKGLAPLALAGTALWGLSHVVLGLVQASDASVDPRVFAGISGAGALLLALVVTSVLGAGIKAGIDSARDDELQADPWGGGGTLEWAAADAIPTSVESPYPLLDSKGGE